MAHRDDPPNDPSQSTTVAVPRDQSPDAGPERGSVVGRYIIIDKLGSGGMGVVYKAYDPELERAIALKFVRAARGLDSQGRNRLIREAQALAQLAHPNVVSVYDVGTFQDSIFIAIELVGGQTLHDWLRAEPRKVREILHVFEQAGRGLQAAHDAGIVHRDFKPTNVIVGDDGRVRVLDFGLALEVHKEDVPIEVEPPSPTPSSGRRREALTVPGLIIGTPHYMAPEQHLGETPDARTDQFSFCVALYEALYGEFPFHTKKDKDYRHAVMIGKLRGPPADAHVPRRVYDALARGLSKTPSDRWGSIDELIDELIRDPGAKRRRVLIPAGALVLVGGMAVFTWQATRVHHPLCEGTRSTLSGVWDDTRRSELRSVYESSGLPESRSLWTTTVTKLNRHAEAWQNRHDELCASLGHTRPPSPVIVEDLVCLDRMRTQFRATTELLLEDPTMVSRGPQAALGLRNTCDRQILPAEQPQRWTEEDEEEILTALARGTALHFAGLNLDAQPVATEAIDRARESGHRELLVEALLLRGYIGQFLADDADIKQAEAALREASSLAIAIGADDLAARAETHLIMILSLKEQRYEEAHRAADRANALVQRAGSAPLLHRFYLQQLGVLLALEGRYEESYAVHDAALSQYGDIVDMSTYSLHLNQSEVALLLGRISEAREQARQLVDFSLKHLGAEHMRTDAAYATLTRTELLFGDYRAASETASSALELLKTREVQPPSRGLYCVALALSETAWPPLCHPDAEGEKYGYELAVAQGIHARAAHDTDAMSRAVDWALRKRPKNIDPAQYTPQMYWWLENWRARLLIESGRVDEALEALHGVQSQQHRTDPLIACTDANLGRIALSEGRWEDAREHFRTARDTLSALNPQHAELGAVTEGLASAKTHDGE